MSTSTATTAAKTSTTNNNSAFSPSEVLGFFPNRTTRRKLAAEWKTFSPEKQLSVRAARSSRGIRCDICGLAGYFRENCPNQCTSPPSTPDSLDSTPPSTPEGSLDGERVSASATKSLGASASLLSLSTSVSEQPSTGIFWGDSKDVSEITGKKSAYQMKQKPDMSKLRVDARDRQAELKHSDATSAGSFTFFSHSDHTYARTYAELSLQQVMRRMMRLLEKQLIKNADNLEAEFDTTLLHPPSDKIGKKFYPDEFLEVKDFREYFYKKESKIKGNLNYKYQGNIRPIDELDVMFRGQSLNANSLYETKPNAGESIHAKNTWKSILAKNDILANSDPIMAKKQEKINQLFKNQSKWIEMQSKSMTYRNDRYEHMVFILQNEIHKEHEREGKLLEAPNKRVSKNSAMEIYQERLGSVDLMMNVLQSYKFTSGLDEADFLLFCLERWEEETRIRLSDEYRKNNIDSEEEDQRLSLIYGEHYKSKRLRKKGKKGNKQSKGQTKDLVAASTHPYFQDQQFLNAAKKKQERMHINALSGKAFNVSEHKQKEKLALRSKSAGDNVSADESCNSADEEDQSAIEDAPIAEPNSTPPSWKKPKKPLTIVQQRKHPRQLDAEHIAKMELSFRRAGLANRIRKGNDDDYAHSLPALIPIPKAFDGNGHVSSYTGQNIIFQLKKEMVLSDIGYTRQTAVPLYVRNTLMETEGTSVNGDPTQKELTADRRYSHYLGRPFVRFNKPKTPPPPREKPAVVEASTESVTFPKLKMDLTALADFDVATKNKQSFKTLHKNTSGKYVSDEVDNNEYNHNNEYNVSGSASVGSDTSSIPISVSKSGSLTSMDRASRKALRRERRHAKTVPISRSLVRMAFKADPTLEDLKYLDEEF